MLHRLCHDTYRLFVGATIRDASRALRWLVYGGASGAKSRFDDDGDTLVVTTVAFRATGLTRAAAAAAAGDVVGAAKWRHENSRKFHRMTMTAGILRSTGSTPLVVRHSCDRGVVLRKCRSTERLRGKWCACATLC